MEVTWNQPYDGNSVILNYIVQYKLVACKYFYGVSIVIANYYCFIIYIYTISFFIILPAPALWTIDPAKVIVAGTQTVSIIEGLTPATAYHIRVLAENGIGTSEPSDETQAITQEEGNLPTIYVPVLTPDNFPFTAFISTKTQN